LISLNGTDAAEVAISWTHVNTTEFKEYPSAAFSDSLQSVQIVPEPKPECIASITRLDLIDGIFASMNSFLINRLNDALPLQKLSVLDV